MSQTGPDVHNVSVLDDVFLAFQPQLAFGLRLVHPAQADEIVVVHHLRPDEAALQVGVDLARGFLRGRAAARFPGSYFILAGRKDCTRSRS
jgi:hypothetical protein